MLYSVYSKWIINEINESTIEYHDVPLFNNWVLIGNGLTINEVIEVLDTCENNSYADNYIQVVLPDISIGNTVMNIKTHKIGKVVYFDQFPIQTFNIFDSEDGLPKEKLYEFATIESEEGERLTWEIRDLIVIN